MIVSASSEVGIRSTRRTIHGVSIAPASKPTSPKTIISVSAVHSTTGTSCSRPVPSLSATAWVSVLPSPKSKRLK